MSMTQEAFFTELNITVFLKNKRLIGTRVKGYVLFISLFTILISETKKNVVEELQTDPQNARLPTWLGCLGCQRAAGYPKTQFFFYAVKIL